MIDKINEEYLEFDEDQRLLEGIPYTGIGFLEYPDHSLEREVYYVDGYEHGLCKEWYPNGQLKCEWNAIHGRAAGKVKQWYDSGKIKSVGEYEYGVEIAYKEWDEHGKLLIDREIDEKSELYKYLMKMRMSGRELNV
jgi:antitoxin component YwqK of YwqJK toxin-antitoxin module